MKTTTITCAAVLLSCIAGCASKPPAELRDARNAYNQAARAPGANLVQTEVYESKKSLDRAEAKFADDGDSPETRDLSYVALRKAQSTQAKAAAQQAMQQKQMAAAQMEQMRQQQQAQMRAELERTKGQLTQAQQMTESERQARIAAEQKTRDALLKIEGMQQRQDPRGLILTLSGSVLFEFGKSQLLPPAQKRLSQVVDALKQDPRNITVVGHTDSKGTEAKNMELSQRRAEAVRSFLVTHGIPQERVTAEGVGETQPIASNESPEGRANNRRVEIILQSDEQQGGTEQRPGGMQQQPGGMQQQQQQQREHQHQHPGGAR